MNDSSVDAFRVIKADESHSCRRLEIVVVAFCNSLFPLLSPFLQALYEMNRLYLSIEHLHDVHFLGAVPRASQVRCNHFLRPRTNRDSDSTARRTRPFTAGLGARGAEGPSVLNHASRKSKQRTTATILNSFIFFAFFNWIAVRLRDGTQRPRRTHATAGSRGSTPKGRGSFRLERQQARRKQQAIGHGGEGRQRHQ